MSGTTITKHNKMATLHALQQGACAICGAYMIKPDEARDRDALAGFQAFEASDPTLDHVVPRSHNGRNELRNLILVHRDCNELRGNGKMPHRAHKVWRKNWDELTRMMRAGEHIYG